MYVGKRHAGEEWTDILGWSSERVIIDKDGFGIFFVSAMSVSVWVNAAAEGRNTLGRHLYVSDLNPCSSTSRSLMAFETLLTVH